MDIYHDDLDYNFKHDVVRVRTPHRDFNPKLVKQDNVLNRWKKFLLTKNNEVLKQYKLHFSHYINTSNNAVELLKFINGLLYDRSVSFLGKIPAEYDLKYYTDVSLEIH